MKQGKTKKKIRDRALAFLKEGWTPTLFLAVVLGTTLFSLPNLVRPLGGSVIDAVQGGITLKEWTEDVDQRFSKALVNRKLWISANRTLNYLVCSPGPTFGSTVIGDKGWLFYFSYTDGDARGIFAGTTRYTPMQMQAYGDHLAQAQEVAQKYGATFSFMLAPNKQTVYPEMVPESIPYGPGPSCTDELVEYLQKRGDTDVIYPKALLQNENKLALWHPYDSHWNQLGAYTAVRPWIEKNAGLIPPPEELVMKTEKMWVLDSASIDLIRMPGLELLYTGRTVQENSIVCPAEIERQGPDGKGVTRIQNAQAPFKQSVLLIGDSFKTALTEILPNEFEEVLVLNSGMLETVPMEEYLEQYRPDHVLMVCVERYTLYVPGYRMAR